MRALAGDRTDGRGAGRDIGLAVRLRDIPRGAWGPLIERHAWLICRKHADTLAAVGVDVASIDEPPGPDALPAATVRAVFERDNAIVLAFSFDQALWQAVQQLPERAYDRERKDWALPLTRETAEALVGLLNAYTGFTVEPGCAATLRRLLSGETLGRPTRYAEPDGDHVWRLVLPRPSRPRDFQLVEAAGAIPKSRFIRDDGGISYWRIDTRTAGALDRLLMLLADFPEVHLDETARAALPNATVKVDLEPAQAGEAQAPASEKRPDSRWVKANIKTFVIDPGGDRAISNAIRPLLGAKFDKGTDKTKHDGRWSVPRHPMIAPALSAIVAEHELWIAASDRAALERLAAIERLRFTHQGKLAALSRAQSLPEHITASALTGFGKTLHPFQRIPVVYPRLGVRGIWIADSMGLGKTPEALATIFGEKATPCVVVCPKSHTLNWARREIADCVPGANVVVLRGQKPAPAVLEGCDYAVIQQDLVSYWRKELIKRQFAALVADESHNFAGNTSKRTQAVDDLAADIRGRGGIVILLTGTPKKNGRNTELVPQLDILGELDRIGARLNDPPTALGRILTPRQKFLHWFCEPKPDKHAGSGYRFDGSSHDEVLHEMLRETCYIRRHKNEVFDQLPAKTRPMVPLELTATDLRDYKRAQADIVSFLRDHHGQAAELEALIAGLSRERAQQIAADVARRAGERASRAPGLVAMNTLRRLIAQAKLPAVIEWTRQFLTSDEKLVLFAVGQDIQDALVAAFPGCATITHRDSVEQIEANKERFQTDPACQLIVCSLNIAKEGHTLTAASNVAFCELDWAPLALEQAEDRCYGRLSDLHGATCWYLLGVGPEQWGDFQTIDEIMAHRIDKKRESNARTTDGDKADELMGEAILDEVLEAMTAVTA